MLCNNCNHQGGNGKFCSYCGVALQESVKCTNCSTLSSTKYCAHCGTNLDASNSSPRENLLKIYGSTLVVCDNCATQMTVPTCVTQIDEYAFGNCQWLESVVIPGTVKTIGEFAFYRCAGLEQATLHHGIVSIGEFTFSGCTKLKDIHFIGTKSQWESVQKGEQWNNKMGSCTIHCTDGDVQI